MWKRVGMGLVIMLMAAACGNSDATSITPTTETIVDGTDTNNPDANATIVEAQNNADDTSNTTSGATGVANSTIEVSGAATASVEATGTYLCTDDTAGMPSVLTIALTASDFTTVSFTLAADAATGKYNVVTMTATPTDDEANATVTLQGSQVYSGTTGTVTLDALPTGPDQAVTGSFDFTAASMTNATQTVNVKGTFDFTSPNATQGADASRLYCE
jgi:hypothetical protein